MDEIISKYLINTAKRIFDKDSKKIYFEAHKILRKTNNVVYVYAYIGAYLDGKLIDWNVGPIKIEINNLKIVKVDYGNENDGLNIYDHYKSFLPESLIEICLNENVQDSFYKNQIKKYIDKNINK